MAPRKRARKRPRSNKRPSATVRPYMHACNYSSPLHQQSSSPFISARSRYLVVPLAPRRRRRSIHTLALAVPPLSIAANEIRLRGSAALRRCRGRFKHFGLPGRVLVLGVVVFVLVAVHALTVALATAGSAALVFLFLGAGFCFGGRRC